MKLNEVLSQYVIKFFKPGDRISITSKFHPDKSGTFVEMTPSAGRKLVYAKIDSDIKRTYCGEKDYLYILPQSIKIMGSE